MGAAALALLFGRFNVRREQVEIREINNALLVLPTSTSLDLDSDLDLALYCSIFSG